MSPARVLALLVIWHGVLSLGLFGVGISGLLRAWHALDVVRGAAHAAAVWLAVLSAAAALCIARRAHLGRTLSLVTHYLVFVAALIGLASLLDWFKGLDDLADYAARGTPFLMAFVIVVGYAVRTYERRERPVSPLRRAIGAAVMIAGGVGLALSVGITTALVSWVAKLVAGGWEALGWIGLMIASLFMLRVMWRAPVALWLGARSVFNERLTGWLFLSPNLLGFALFFAGPLLFSLYVSFTNWDAFARRDWVGLENYARVFTIVVQPLATPDQPASEALDIRAYSELFRVHLPGQSFLVGARDRLFWIALGNTLRFGAMAVPLSVVPALLLAVLLNTRLPGMRLYRTLYFIPSIAAVVGVALIWQWMYNSQVGWINYFITSAINAINQVLGTRIPDPQIRWLADSNYALLSVVIMSAWQWIGFNTVLFLAGLQTIPRELYEAATVDGANGRQRFFYITLPMLAPTTLYVLITSTIQALQVFDQVFIISNGTGGPGTSTLTMTLNLYQNGFQSFRQGYASALAWVLFVVIFIFTLFQFRRQRQASGAYDL
ncbi:MAG: sugar ABC transporter permease [Thermoflexales bacterium]|nr:sugar ABC transporter permease [Thermoflexales bacterium]